jgi:hypothetical protein
MKVVSLKTRLSCCWFGHPYVKLPNDTWTQGSAHSGDAFLYEKENAYASAVPRDNQSLAWIADNQEQLYRDYPNEWILVSNQVVVAHSQSAADIETAARELGITNALVTKAVKPTQSERTIYVFG